MVYKRNLKSEWAGKTHCDIRHVLKTYPPFPLQEVPCIRSSWTSHNFLFAGVMPTVAQSVLRENLSALHCISRLVSLYFICFIIFVFHFSPFVMFFVRQNSSVTRVIGCRLYDRCSIPDSTSKLVVP